jgi:aminomethyltransferase
MGQIVLKGKALDTALERLVPADIAGLADHQCRYTMFTNEAGGVIDDLMVTRIDGETLALVVNAGGKHADYNHLVAQMPSGIDIELQHGQALLALQGPEAASVLAGEIPEIRNLAFMQGGWFTLYSVGAYITRSGYTGEDGFEISIPGEDAEMVARRLLGHPGVEPIGLGARDSLRLEAGLCLYGHELDPSITPIEAGLAWTIGKRRREEGGFFGEAVILEQLKNKPSRRRVGILPEGRAPARDGTEILDRSGTMIGHITSGGFSPSLDRPIAMGYVNYPLPDVNLSVRGKALPAQIVPLPFVPHSYHTR